MSRLISLYHTTLRHINCLSPVMPLILRLWIAHVFWASGILKIQDFDTTIELFTSEHPVPFLPPLIAAICGTFFELTCPILLTLGLGTRLAVLPLFMMTLVINFTYLEATEHYYWMMLLGTLFFWGGGKLSLDHLIAKKFGSITMKKGKK